MSCAVKRTGFELDRCSYYTSASELPGQKQDRGLTRAEQHCKSKAATVNRVSIFGRRDGQRIPKAESVAD
eukprot:3590320-Rhodomonas_salina.3